MHYPWWYVPWLTSPMLIAGIATLHVFVAMFAVGGGFIMALGAREAYRTDNRDLLDYFRQFAWFFVLITVVYGAITGVGIWWVIGLASPLATEELIHIFVFVWGMEYAAFLVEIVSAFAFLYGWGRLDPRTHQTVGWIYAASAWLSLVLITGITAFMLNSGGWATGGGLWRAFWNPQTIPQILSRTGVSLMLAALFVFTHAAFKLNRCEGLCQQVVRLTSSWAMLGGVLIIVGGALWYLYAPPSAQAALVGAAALNVLVALLFGLTALVVVTMYFGPYRNPRWVGPGFAILFLSMGFAATASGEFVREAVRKPYIVYGAVLGNGIRASEVPKLRAEGYLDGGIWTHVYIGRHYPQVLDAGGRVDAVKLLALPDNKRREVGRVLFQYHCNDCHAAHGYSGADQLARGWTRSLIEGAVIAPDAMSYFMPPFCGAPEEAIVLSDYVQSIARPYPAGLVQPDGTISK
jgi:cytochrome d ubiquinol oxidase subunit I